MPRLCSASAIRLSLPSVKLQLPRKHRDRLPPLLSKRPRSRKRQRERRHKKLLMQRPPLSKRLRLLRLRLHQRSPRTQLK